MYQRTGIREIKTSGRADQEMALPSKFLVWKWSAHTREGQMTLEEQSSTDQGKAADPGSWLYR